MKENKSPVFWNERLAAEGLGVIGPLTEIGGVPVQQGGGGHFSGRETDSPTTTVRRIPIRDSGIRLNGVPLEACDELIESEEDKNEPTEGEPFDSDRLKAISDWLVLRGHARLDRKTKGRYRLL